MRILRINTDFSDQGIADVNAPVWVLNWTTCLWKNLLVNIYVVNNNFENSDTPKIETTINK